MFRLISTFAWIVFVCGAATDWNGASAQEAPAPAAPAVDPVSSGAADEFDTRFTEWKTNLADLRDIYQEYQNAEDDELASLEQRWKEKIAKGKAMVGPLRAAALAKYAAEPNVDRQLSKFLLKLAADHIKSDDYPAALEICKPLVANSCDERDLDNLTGIAAFGSNVFDLAEVHLIEASRNGTLSEQGQQFFAALPECQSTWEEEQQLREREAAADDLPRVKLITDVGEVILELFENEAARNSGQLLESRGQGLLRWAELSSSAARFHGSRRLPQRRRNGRSWVQNLLRMLER